MRARFLPLILLATLVAPAAETRADAAQPKLPTVLLTIGGKSVNAEVADEDGERERGLMFRKTMGENDGMLFVFDRPTQASFWMRNTTIPLSVAYISISGIILEIHDLNPLDERPVSSAFDTIAYALEMPRGWFEKGGVLSGDSIAGLPPIAR
jgi:uncharacterized membrane protein (UPF0127 family)